MKATGSEVETRERMFFEFRNNYLSFLDPQCIVWRMAAGTAGVHTAASRLPCAARDPERLTLLLRAIHESRRRLGVWNTISAVRDDCETDTYLSIGLGSNFGLSLV